MNKEIFCKYFHSILSMHFKAAKVKKNCKIFFGQFLGNVIVDVNGKMSISKIRKSLKCGI